MTTLSFTQEYFACAVNGKGKAPFSKETEIMACLVVGGVLELTMGGYIQADEEEKYISAKILDKEKIYLQSVYDVVVQKPMKLSDIASKYVESGKLFRQYFNAIGESLDEAGVAEKSVENGLFGEKMGFIPTQDCLTAIIEKVRAELLEDGTVSDETIVLCALLEKGGLIKDYFSKVELGKLNLRLKEISSSDAHNSVRKVIESVDASIAIVAAIVVATSVSV